MNISTNKIPNSEPNDSPGELWIAEHVYVCAMPEGATLLDLRRNKYLGLSLRDCLILERVVGNWPKCSSEIGMCYEPPSAEELSRLTQALIDIGVLVRQPPSPHQFRADKIDLNCALSDTRGDGSTPITTNVVHIMRFLSACVWAQVGLRLRPFHSLVREIAQRKQSTQFRVDGFNMARAVELARVFAHLRPFVFTARGHCLFHALTLIRFLSYYDVHPTWVIAVRARPFGAHTWVQQDSTLFDCFPDQVWDYTPILAL